MRILLHNPQKVNLYGKTVKDFFTQGKVKPKLGHLLPLIIRKKIGIYIDDFGSSFKLKNSYNSIFYKYLELYLWLIINKINPFKILIIHNKNNIKLDDVLISITHLYLDSNHPITASILTLPCVKLLHTTHYSFHTKNIATNISKNNLIYLIGENDLKKNSLFFQNYFQNYLNNFYYLPYAYDPRFQKNKDFSKRINKCLALGTFQIHDLAAPEHSELTEFFNENTFHSMRKFIYFNQSELSQYIDSFISYINIDINDALSKVSKPQGNIFQKLKIKLLNFYYLNYKGNYTRRAYYNFDIIKKYNDYKMIIVPEEIIDFPGISFIEAMACGCVLVAIRDPMYTDIGLIDGVNYIGYGKNDIGSMTTMIDYYQNHPMELSVIAENSYRFAKDNFSYEKISSTFINDIINTFDSKLINKKIHFTSSFVDLPQQKI